MRLIKTYSIGLVIVACLHFAQFATAQCAMDDCSGEALYSIDDLFTDPEKIPTPEFAGEINPLPDTQKIKLNKQIADIFKAARETSINKKSKNREKAEVSKLTFYGWDGKEKTVSVDKSAPDTELKKFIRNAMEKGSGDASVGDLEGFLMEAGVPVSFQDSLADFFTPYYRVSNYESDQFATFQDNPNHVIASLHGQNPLSYYRVHPMGFLEDQGTQYGFFKIDYLTLWNNDSGLQISSACISTFDILFYYYYYYPEYFGWLGSVFAALNGLGGHAYDDERSALLVGAPVTAPFVYNEDPYAYYVYSTYAAAHEYTQSDRSVYTYPDPAEQGHVELFLALSKHGTYFGNPYGVPLTPDWIISASFSSLQSLYLAGVIDSGFYNYLWSVLENAFYGCIIEHFQYGGVQGFASPRINVGEPIPGQILNGCGFIVNSDHVLPKLQSQIWDLGFIPEPEVPTSLTVIPGTLMLPGTVTYHIDVPNISVDIEYYHNGNGPYYTADYATMTSNGSGDIPWNYGLGSPVGTYTFTRIRNVAGGSWNNINATLVLQPPASPTSLTVSPTTITLPYTVTFHIDIPNISVDIEYYIEGNGPYYTGTLTANGSGNIFKTYATGSTPGTYIFTRIINVNGGSWNNVSATLEVEEQTGPSCQDLCDMAMSQCVTSVLNYCQSSCQGEPMCIYMCLSQYIPGCQQTYDACLAGCQ